MVTNESGEWWSDTHAIIVKAGSIEFWPFSWLEGAWPFLAKTPCGWDERDAKV